MTPVLLIFSQLFITGLRLLSQGIFITNSGHHDTIAFFKVIAIMHFANYIFGNFPARATDDLIVSKGTNAIKHCSLTGITLILVAFIFLLFFVVNLLIGIDMLNFLFYGCLLAWTNQYITISQIRIKFLGRFKLIFLTVVQILSAVVLFVFSEYTQYYLLIWIFTAILTCICCVVLSGCDFSIATFRWRGLSGFLRFSRSLFLPFSYTSLLIIFSLFLGLERIYASLFAVSGNLSIYFWSANVMLAGSTIIARYLRFYSITVQVLLGLGCYLLVFTHYSDSDFFALILLNDLWGVSVKNVLSAVDILPFYLIGWIFFNFLRVSENRIPVLWLFSFFTVFKFFAYALTPPDFWFFVNLIVPVIVIICGYLIRKFEGNVRR